MAWVSQVFKTVMGDTGKQPSLDGMLAKFDRELGNFQTLVQPDATSRPRTPFDSPNLTFDQMYMSRLTLGQILSFLPVMIPLRVRMGQSARLYDGKLQPSQSQASPEFLSALENLARTAGAADMRYVRVPRNAIFQHKGVPHAYAVVITVEMDKEKLANAPSFDAFLEVARGYGNLARIGNQLARFMRRSGFAAYPGTALGGLTDYTHLAEVAGLGAIGYHGLLITPNEGARLRINTIYTNITNLPIQTENEHLWVRDFCAMCKKCIRGCPIEAIYEQPRPRGDGGMQCIDHTACRDYFNQNYGCAVCLAKCPFSDVGYEKVKARFKGNPKAPQLRIPVSRG
jgi:ferredoxin